MKIGFVSLGCPKNLVDTEVMMGQLTAQGHELTPHPSDADVIVVNTCSFIDPAKQESVDTILEMAEYKKTGRARKLIVAGCLVERYRGDIQKNMPEVDAVIGTNELEQITSLCEGVEPAERNPFEPYLYHDATPRVLATPRHFAYIKIAEGCDHPCTFCVIPQYRGQFRSRRFESVISEATRLFSQGVREINLIGQDTTCYGEDLGLKDGSVAIIGSAGADRDRTRQVGPVPVLLSEQGDAEAARYHRRACGAGQIHRHAAAARQRFCAETDEARGTTAISSFELLERIRQTIPGVAIRTSMIVGFPGETEADFKELCDFVEAAQFDRMGAFSYSDEDTSKSFALDAKVDGRTIQNRKRRLMAIQRKISRARNRTLVGREMDVLIEGPSADSELVWQARLSTQAPDIDGVCYISDPGEAPLRAGEFRRMRITKAHDYDLTGELVAGPPGPADVGFTLVLIS